ncbi:MAG: hypothetical protein RLZZ127_830, partial [Planctomycetota bacterium]
MSVVPGALPRLVLTLLAVLPVLAVDQVTTIAGTGVQGSGGDNGSATAATIGSIFGIADVDQGVVIAGNASGVPQVRLIRSGGIIEAFPNATGLGSANGIAGAGSDIYLADSGKHVVWKIGPGGISVAAGKLNVIDSVIDPVDPTNTGLTFPEGVAFRAPYLYVADTGRHRILRIDTSAVPQTVELYAGQFNAGGFGGDGSIATSATFSGPRGLFVDQDNNLYVADSSNHAIRRIDGGTHVVTTLAGVGGTSGTGGEFVAATSAKLAMPAAVTVAPDGSIYIAEEGLHRIRRVSGGQVWTYAGATTAGFAGDGLVPGTATRFDSPAVIHLGATGDLLVGDGGNYRVRSIGRNDIAVTGVAPAAARPGDTITITGTGFEAGASVTIDGLASPSVVVQGTTSIQCTVPAAAAGWRDVTVTVPVGTFGSTARTLAKGLRVGGVVTWTGSAADGQWENAANWSPAVLPSSFDDVRIAVAGYNPIITSSATVATLEIQYSAGLTVNGSAAQPGRLTVSGTMAVAGDLAIHGATAGVPAKLSVLGTDLRVDDYSARVQVFDEGVLDLGAGTELRLVQGEVSSGSTGSGRGRITGGTVRLETTGAFLDLDGNGMNGQWLDVDAPIVAEAGYVTGSGAIQALTTGANAEPVHLKPEAYLGSAGVIRVRGAVALGSRTTITSEFIGSIAGMHRLRVEAGGSLDLNGAGLTITPSGQPLGGLVYDLITVDPGGSRTGVMGPGLDEGIPRVVSTEPDGIATLSYAGPNGSVQFTGLASSLIMDFNAVEAAWDQVDNWLEGGELASAFPGPADTARIGLYAPGPAILPVGMTDVRNLELTVSGTGGIRLPAGATLRVGDGSGTWSGGGIYGPGTLLLAPGSSLSWSPDASPIFIHGATVGRVAGAMASVAMDGTGALALELDDATIDLSLFEVADILATAGTSSITTDSIVNRSSGPAAWTADPGAALRVLVRGGSLQPQTAADDLTMSGDVQLTIGGGVEMSQQITLGQHPLVIDAGSGGGLSVVQRGSPASATIAGDVEILGGHLRGAGPLMVQGDLFATGTDSRVAPEYFYDVGDAIYYHSAETITVTGSATLAAGARLKIRLFSDGAVNGADRLVLPNSVLRGAPFLEVDWEMEQTTPPGTGAMIVVQNAGSGMADRFTNLPDQFAPIQVGGVSFYIDYTAGDGNDIALVPGTAPANTAPGIAGPGDQTIPEDGATGPLAVVLSDAETLVGSLVLSATSSDPALIPAGGLALAGSGATRSIAITPAADQSGSAVITLGVTDGGGLSTTFAVTVTVTPVNDLPSLTGVVDLTIPEDTATGPFLVL